jgi:tetratricopeptide (TPR) repeat protein
MKILRGPPTRKLRVTLHKNTQFDKRPATDFSDTPLYMRTSFITIMAAALLFGCAHNQGAIQKVSEKDADKLNAQNSRFENTDSPPINAETRFAAGQLAESQGQIAQAVEQYREVLKLNPKHPQALYRLGIIYTETKQYDLAIEVWRQYVKVNNGSATAISNLGFCYELAGQLPEAEKAYNIGIEKEPHNQPCRVNYGLMLVRTGRVKEAAQQLSVVLRPAEVHYNIASVYEQTGKKEEAKAEYKKALDSDPKFWEARTRLADMK